MSVYRTTVVMY